MADKPESASYDFKGIGFSKIGHFKEVRFKIKELENLNLELARGHNELEAIINSVSDGLTILDKTLRIVFVNKVQRIMFPDVSLIGKKCFSAFYRKQQICRNCPALKTMETEKILRGEVMIREGEFSGRYYEWTTSPIKDPLGTVSKIVLLMRDITERKEYEFNLMRADRMAAIGLLAAGIAHEINNPLTSIAGFSEGLIKRLKANEEFFKQNNLATFKDYLEIINSEVYRCKEIIQNLVNFSHKSTDDYEIITIDQIINDSGSLVRKHAKDNNINFVLKHNLASGFNQIIGNESQLKHLFLNVFKTALESMGEGGELNVASKNVGNIIEIVISNGGGGFQLKVEGKGASPSLSGKNGAGGVPLSLSICYSIMRNHSGSMELKDVGSGESVLVLRFPPVVA